MKQCNRVETADDWVIAFFLTLAVRLAVCRSDPSSPGAKISGWSPTVRYKHNAVTLAGIADAQFMRVYPRSLIATLVAVIASGCDAPPPTSSQEAVPPPMRAPAERREQNAPPPQMDGDLRARQLAFLNRIREADPQQRTIERALLNEQNELGLILDRSVEMDKIPNLMRTMLAQMAKEFPGHDLTVIAYTPSNPPHKIGTARLNSRTRDMIYTPEA